MHLDLAQVLVLGVGVVVLVQVEGAVALQVQLLPWLALPITCKTSVNHFTVIIISRKALTVPRLESFSKQWLHTLAITPLFLEQTFLVNMTTIFSQKVHDHTTQRQMLSIMGIHTCSL